MPAHEVGLLRIINLFQLFSIATGRLNRSLDSSSIICSKLSLVSNITLCHWHFNPES
jgi:hypothetical protein